MVCMICLWCGTTKSTRCYFQANIHTHLRKYTHCASCEAGTFELLQEDMREPNWHINHLGSITTPNDNSTIRILAICPTINSNRHTPQHVHKYTYTYVYTYFPTKYFLGIFIQQHLCNSHKHFIVAREQILLWTSATAQEMCSGCRSKQYFNFSLVIHSNGAQTIRFTMRYLCVFLTLCSLSSQDNYPPSLCQKFCFSELIRSLPLALHCFLQTCLLIWCIVKTPTKASSVHIRVCEPNTPISTFPSHAAVAAAAAAAATMTIEWLVCYWRHLKCLYKYSMTPEGVNDRNLLPSHTHTSWQDLHC